MTTDDKGYDIFISVKNLDRQRSPTKDYRLAEHLYSFLTARGYRVFLSEIILQKDGVARYRKAINKALESAQVLVAVGTSRENLESEWVEYEWGSFSNEINSHRKPKGRIFSYISEMAIADLPYELRQYTSIEHSPDGFERLASYLGTAHFEGGTTIDGHVRPDREEIENISFFNKIRQMSQKRGNAKVSSEDHPSIGQNRTEVTDVREKQSTIVPLLSSECIINHDVFISYSVADKSIADAVCVGLEAQGIRCWIAPRNIFVGTDYREAIIDAINTSKIMVIIYSSHSNDSPQVIREVSVAMLKRLTIIPFKIEDAPPSLTMAYSIGQYHWLDALTPPLEMHIDELSQRAKALLKSE